MEDIKQENICVEDADAASGLAREASSVDPRKERRLLLKQDLIIIPILWVMFFVAYLDRGAIGNARLMGIQTSLHLTNRQYLQGLMIFYVGFFISDFPIGLSMKIFPAQVVFGFSMVVFGITAVVMPWSGGFAGLMVLRFILGCGEAVFTMGFLYLSQWYKPEELALRTALMYWSTPIASFCSGLISYGVGKHLTHGLSTWKYLYIVEGVPTIVCGLIVMLILPGFPDSEASGWSLWFRKKEEKDILIARSFASQNTPHEKIRKHQIMIGLKDPKTYLSSLNVLGATCGIVAFGVLLPTIIHSMGFDPLTANLYTIIPYSFAIVSMPIASWVADKYRARALPHAICLSISVVGCVICLASTNHVLSLAGCCFIAGSIFPDLVISTSWLTTTHGGYTKRALAFAVSQFFVQGTGIMCTQIFTHPPHFFLGFGILLGVDAIALASCGILYVMLKRENCKRDEDAQKRASGELPPLGDIGTIEDLCDFHPDYRYTV